MNGSLFQDDPFKVSKALDGPPSKTKLRKPPEASHSGSRSRREGSGGGGERSRSSREGGSSRDGERSSGRSKEGRPKPTRQKSSGGSDGFGNFDENGFPDSAFGTAFADPSFEPEAEQAQAPSRSAAPPAGGRQRRTRRASIAASSCPPAPAPAEQEPTADDYGYGYESHAPAAPDTGAAAPRRRGRRSSCYGDGGPAGRRVEGVKSCEGLEAMQAASRRRSGSGDASVSSGVSDASGGSAEAPRRPRRGRRASVSAGSGFNSAHSAPDSGFGHDHDHVDYGYGDDHHSAGDGADYGYGDPADSAPKQEKPQRERRTRGFDANKLVDDLKSGDMGVSKQTSSRQLGVGAGANSMVAPMVLPMAQDKQPRPRRRASLIGAVGLGGPKKTKEVEKTPQYDPSQDRERRANNSLLERVGSSDSGAAGGNAGRSSYSDRIMKGR